MAKRKMTEAQKLTQFQRKDYVYNFENYLKSDNTYDREKLLRDARKQAKNANQRLYRLEKAGYTSAPAYRGAQKALSGLYSKDGNVAFGGFTKGGKPRYKTNVDSLTNAQLRELLYAVSKTQTAVSSTPAAVESLYTKGTENLNKMIANSGSRLSVNDVMDLMRDKAFGEVDKLFGYKAVLQLISDLDEEEAILTQEDWFEKTSDRISGILKETIENNTLNLTTIRSKLGLKNKTIDKTRLRAW